MATWMMHLRITDLLLQKFPCLSPVEFVFGSLAPDSGKPNPDGVTYSPSADISHFKTNLPNGHYDINVNLFVKQFLSDCDANNYSNRQLSFYLGYMSHLLTDALWSEEIQRKTVYEFLDEYNQNRLSFLWRMKKDWYDLDFCFMNNNLPLESFNIYKKCDNFENLYLSFFPNDAFSLKQTEIIRFYSQQPHNLDREYVYLTYKQYNAFAENAFQNVSRALGQYLK